MNYVPSFVSIEPSWEFWHQSNCLKFELWKHYSHKARCEQQEETGWGKEIKWRRGRRFCLSRKRMYSEFLSETSWSGCKKTCPGEEMANWLLQEIDLQSSLRSCPVWARCTASEEVWNKFRLWVIVLLVRESRNNNLYKHLSPVKVDTLFRADFVLHCFWPGGVLHAYDCHTGV